MQQVTYPDSTVVYRNITWNNDTGCVIIFRDFYKFSLRSRIQPNVQMTETDWFMVVLGIASRLTLAHYFGIGHGDLCPSNGLSTFKMMSLKSISFIESRSARSDSINQCPHHRFRHFKLVSSRASCRKNCSSARLDLLPVSWDSTFCKYSSCAPIRYMGIRLHWIWDGHWWAFIPRQQYCGDRTIYWRAAFESTAYSSKIRPSCTGYYSILPWAEP